MTMICIKNYAVNQSEIRIVFDICLFQGFPGTVGTKAKLRNAAETHMAMLEQTPERIIKYFEDPAIRYAAVAYILAG